MQLERELWDGAYKLLNKSSYNPLQILKYVFNIYIRLWLCYTYILLWVVSSILKL